MSGLAARVEALAMRAAERIMAVYATDFEVDQKSDASPVTAADLAAHRLLCEGLPAVEAVPVLSEESAPPAFAERAGWERYWLVDPLDGTKGFVRRTGDFAVCIALVERGAPRLGLVLAPARERCYWAVTGEGAFLREGAGPARALRTRRPAAFPLVVATSRSRRSTRTEAFIERLGEVRRLSLGSAIKSCLVAAGEADVYPGFSRTSEWDTAAAQCIVEEAGGALLDLHLRPLRYNRQASVANPRFLAVGDPAFDWRRYLADL